MVDVAPWPARHNGGYVVFDNKMWIISGDGRTDVWSSSDSIHWTEELVNAPWGQRYKPYVVAFNNKIWLMGGTDVFVSPFVFYNAVWSSSDGINWVREVEHAPWPARQNIIGTIVHDNKVWIIGGGRYSSDNNIYTETYYNDVWNSSDGINWTKVADSSTWSALPHIIIHGVQATACRISTILTQVSTV